MPAVLVSIIVACRNEVNHIRAFLDSLLAQDMAGISWEAIIADGLSDDGTADVLEEYSRRDSRLHVISNPQRVVSTGLNAAMRTATGEIIIRMDAHTSYAPNYCKLCVETLENTGADNVGGPARTRAVGVRPRAVAAAFHSRFSTGGAKFHNESYEGWVDTVPYGCWRKATLMGLGLFDESLVRNQDDELNLRLTRAGGRIWQNPAIISWYSPRTNLSSLFNQYFQYGFWKVAVIRKHRLPGSWRHLVPVMFVLANILLLTSIAVTSIVGETVWRTISASLFLILAAAYVLASLAASIFTARRHGWVIFSYLPAVFATYHCSFGLGFFTGLLFCLSRSTLTFDAQLPRDSSTFTRITR